MELVGSAALWGLAIGVGVLVGLVVLLAPITLLGMGMVYVLARHHDGKKAEKEIEEAREMADYLNELATTKGAINLLMMGDYRGFVERLKDTGIDLSHVFDDEGRVVPVSDEVKRAADKLFMEKVVDMKMDAAK